MFFPCTCTCLRSCCVALLSKIVIMYTLSLGIGYPGLAKLEIPLFIREYKEHFALHCITYMYMYMYQPICIITELR